MSSSETPKSLEERMGLCPIHQWTDIDGYLQGASVPRHLWGPFHELVLARGELPKNTNPEQNKQFAKQAVAIVNHYQLLPAEAHPLKIMFIQLIRKWLSAKTENTYH